MSPIRHYFATKLAQLLLEQGIQKNELAAAVGVSKPAVTKWVNGSIPDPDTLKKIAEFFGVDPGSLISAPAGSRLYTGPVRVCSSEVCEIKSEPTPASIPVTLADLAEVETRLTARLDNIERNLKMILHTLGGSR